jgi:hypothetical protein
VDCWGFSFRRKSDSKLIWDIASLRSRLPGTSCVSILGPVDRQRETEFRSRETRTRIRWRKAESPVKSARQTSRRGVTLYGVAGFYHRKCPPSAPLKHGGFSRRENFSIIVAASSEDEQRPKIDLALSNTCDGRGAGFCQPRKVAKGSRLVRGDESVQSLLGNPALAFRAAHATVSAARSRRIEPAIFRSA